MTSERDRPLLTLYSRRWCHLCDEMEQALAQLQAELVFDVEIFDVDSDTDLERRFDELVPILFAGDAEICRYRLDPSALRAYLLKFR